VFLRPDDRRRRFCRPHRFRLLEIEHLARFSQTARERRRGLPGRSGEVLIGAVAAIGQLRPYEANNQLNLRRNHLP
jgi:hypothetical protein